MSMTEYETTVIVRPDVSGDVVETTLDRIREVIKSQGGKLLAIDHWGKKKLAYDIAKQSRGVYVHLQFLGGNQLVREMERHLRISDNVLRFMSIRVASGIKADSREEKAYVRPQYDAETSPDDADEVDERDRDRDHDRDYDRSRDQRRDRDRDRGHGAASRPSRDQEQSDHREGRPAPARRDAAADTDAHGEPGTADMTRSAENHG